nr:MAG TPA: hypothetical protein [Caudoviricetes sp.]
MMIRGNPNHFSFLLNTKKYTCSYFISSLI